MFPSSNGRTIKARTNHSFTHRTHKLYDTWSEMKSRCYNIKSASYERYGARGVKICERWLGNETWCGFCAFVEDMGDKPTSQHSIDRKKSSEAYSPGNCRWATSKQQIINRRKMKTNTSGYTGVLKPAYRNRWRAVIYVDNKVIRLGSFDTFEEAVEARKAAEAKYFTPFL